VSDPSVAPHPHPKTLRLTRVQITLSVIAILVAVVLWGLNFLKPSGPTSTVNGPVNGIGINTGTINIHEPAAPAQPTIRAPDPAPISKPNGIYKAIVEKLTAARLDLLGMKTADLSCKALEDWQSRADTATRLAWANGVQIHNAITQHMSSCRDITDVELLDAIRTNIVALLDQGIAAARTR
jgi:hypothetical protein